MSKEYRTYAQLQQAVNKVGNGLFIERVEAVEHMSTYHLSHPSIDIAMTIKVTIDELDVQASLVDHMPMMYLWQEIATELGLGSCVGIHFTFSTMDLRYCSWLGVKDN